MAPAAAARLGALEKAGGQASTISALVSLIEMYCNDEITETRMYLYTELWRFRPAWLELSPDARKQWVDTLLAGVQQQLESGVEVVGFVMNDSDTPHSSGYYFLAVWKMPSKKVAVAFERFVEESGLHEYYEQVNTRGAVMELGAVVDALVEP